MKTKLIVLGIVLALQCSWILATALVQERGLSTGAVVLLETRPVDPRDLLRGDYVVLEYAINSISLNQFSPGVTRDLPNGEPVWVQLEQQGDFHRVSRASLQPIKAEANRPVLRGVVTSSSRTAATGVVRVEYGLERYYVSEGKGNPVGKLTVEASVPKSGHGLIRQVFLNGKPYAEALRDQPKR